MKIGDVVRMIPKKHHPLWKNGKWQGQLDPWKGTVGIIISEYPPPDDGMFVMMTHDPSKKSVETIVINDYDVEVINESR